MIMDFNEYQDLAAFTALYPEAGTGSQLALAYVGLGLGETGEVQGKIKKVIRDDGGMVSPGVRRALMDELGDVLWYIAALARELNVSLDNIAERNIEKLQSRADRGAIGGSGDDR
jgi:NTP pyrophosphatase (non-canonical NTP hydrolase)